MRLAFPHPPGGCPKLPGFREFLALLKRMPASPRRGLLFACMALGWVLPGAARAEVPIEQDPYYRYVVAAPEFRSVPIDPAAVTNRWPTWLYMPWRYQWTIGTGTAGGEFCRDHGINGAFADHGDGPLDWMGQWNLRFYADHTAGKGYLHLSGAKEGRRFAGFQRDARAVRSGVDGPVPLDAALLARLQTVVRGNVRRLKASPMRAAYALDDEISAGVFVLPLAWRLNADDAAYARWLDAYYGGGGPSPRYETPDFLAPQLSRAIRELDFSPLLDRVSYNDSTWANFLGELVATANAEDPGTPCGFVGGQAPNLWGGYDYAKLLHKVQFVEAYNLGSSQAIIRSLGPPTMPSVTTHFHDGKRGSANDAWQAWYYFAHGCRGMIGWVEGWFDGATPRPWLAEFAPSLRELGGVQGPKLTGARWKHDGIAIYYSHPSIQVSWCLDAEAHRGTWVNRNDDHRLGTSHGVRKAWENLLTDAGLQYDFLAYDRVVREGIPDEYQVLVLPACFALSDVEARRIEAFCRRGGLVVADFACGLFDQHGKGRAGGALDHLFGVRHDGTETRKDFFSGRLWVETDQDAGYSAPDWKTLLGTLECPSRDGFAVPERRLGVDHANDVGKGRAIYLNRSPLRYLQYREEGVATAAQRAFFLGAILGKCPPWVRVTAGGVRPRDCEVTYWTRGGRTLLFVVSNPATGGGPEGGNWATRLAGGEQAIELEFRVPVRAVVDERTGEKLGEGTKFKRRWKPNEAVMLGFETPPAP
jgi:hypothetical protein